MVHVISAVTCHEVLCLHVISCVCKHYPRGVMCAQCTYVCCSPVLSACQINVGGMQSVSCRGGESEVLGVPVAELGGWDGFRQKRGGGGQRGEMEEIDMDTMSNGSSS